MKQPILCLLMHFVTVLYCTFFCPEFAVAFDPQHVDLLSYARAVAQETCSDFSHSVPETDTLAIVRATGKQESFFVRLLVCHHGSCR